MAHSPVAPSNVGTRAAARKPAAVRVTDAAEAAIAASQT